MSVTESERQRIYIELNDPLILTSACDKAQMDVSSEQLLVENKSQSLDFDVIRCCSLFV